MVGSTWDWSLFSQFWANLATIVVVLIALGTFLVERKRIERVREEQAFETVTTHYLGFLQMAMDNPDLTLAELDTDKLSEIGSPPRSQPDNRRDAILFEYFFQVIEKVFILYRAADLFEGNHGWNSQRIGEVLGNDEWRKRKLAESKDFRTRQWLGWDAWLASYAKSPRVLAMWESLENDTTYDTKFMAYMDFRLGAHSRDGESSKEPDASDR